MSLVIAVMGPEGIVLAADSRNTFTHTHPQALGPSGETVLLKVNSFMDSAQKILRTDNQPFLAALTWGTASLDPQFLKGPASCLDESEVIFLGKRQSVKSFARHLGQCLAKSWKHQSNAEPMHLVVAGFDEGEDDGRLFSLSVPDPHPIEVALPSKFGVFHGGQTEHAEYLARGIPFRLMALQDCIDFSVFAIQATSRIQGWHLGMCDVGGPVDVVTITRDKGLSVLQMKTIEARSVLEPSPDR